MQSTPPSGEARRSRARRRVAGALDPRPPAGRVAERARRAREYSGHERQVALLLAKSALAAVLSWFVAVHVIGTAQPSYAPFTALLVVQSTVYRSILHSLQYVGAVVIGVGGAGLAEETLGRGMGAFALMITVGLFVGRWRRLGPQGVQVPIAGVFAYTALSGSGQPVTLWSIVSMVLLGAATGLVVNLVLLPPMRYRTAADGVRELATAVHTLLHDVSDGLQAGSVEPDTAHDWSRRAQDIDATVSRARHAVEHGAESVSYNPRRLFSSQVPTGFSGYRTMVASLHRAVDQLRGITTSLLYALDKEDGHTLGADFLRSYGELLGLVAGAARQVGIATDEAKGNLAESLHAGHERHEQLASETRAGAVWPCVGALLTDAARLLEEFDRAQTRGAACPR